MRENSNSLNFVLTAVKMAMSNKVHHYCVPECQNSSNFGLFLFPKNEIQRSAWLSALKMKSARPNDRVCSIHFQRLDFAQGFQRSRLRKHVVPSLFLPSRVRLLIN